MPWVERTELWHRTETQYCQVTGQLLPRRYWLFGCTGNRDHGSGEGCQQPRLAHGLRFCTRPRDSSSAATRPPRP